MIVVRTCLAALALVLGLSLMGCETTTGAMPSISPSGQHGAAHQTTPLETRERSHDF